MEWELDVAGVGHSTCCVVRHAYMGVRVSGVRSPFPLPLQCFPQPQRDLASDPASVPYAVRPNHAGDACGGHGWSPGVEWGEGGHRT